MFISTKHLMLSVVTLVFVSTAIDARDTNAPIAVAEQYFQYLKTSDFRGAAKLYRREDLRDFKALFIPIYKAERREGKNEFLQLTFGKGAKVEDVEQSDPEVFFGNVTEFIFNRNPAGKAKATKMKILGIVEEQDENLVHVIARNYVTVGEIFSNKVEVMSMSNEAGTWKMVMPEQMKAIGQTIQRNIAMQQKASANKRIEPTR